MTREHRMQINGFLYSQLKIVAELRSIDCAETVAELWLRERLDAIPEIAELAKLRSEKRKEADAQWREKYPVNASA